MEKGIDAKDKKSQIGTEVTGSDLTEKSGGRGLDIKAPDTDKILTEIRDGTAGDNAIGITNLSLPVAGDEVSLVLVSGLNQIIIKARKPNQNAEMQLAFVASESSTLYYTIEAYTEFSLDKISFTGKTLYIQSDKATTTVEIIQIS